MITITRIFIILSCLLLSSTITHAQRWVAGSAYTDQPGTYNNSLGSNNAIGARSEAVSWVVHGTTYIFGGIGFGKDPLVGPGVYLF